MPFPTCAVLTADPLLPSDSPDGGFAWFGRPEHGGEPVADHQVPGSTAGVR
ncbi:MAG: hypothetical protein ABIQ18_41380 [Umezawaea sp.]